MRDLIDHAFDSDHSSSIEQVLEEYNRAKSDTFDEMKKKAVEGIIGGSKNYLEKLIKMQTKENSFGQNQTLLKFKDFIT